MTTRGVSGDPDSNRTQTYVRRLSQLLEERDGAGPADLFRDVADDDFWLWINTEGRTTSPAVEAMLPGLPDAEVQTRFTGKAGAATEIEGFAIYQAMRDLHVQHFGSLRERSPILDFGCGWGRVIRYFVKDVPAGQLIGADYDGSNIEFCVASNPSCEFLLSGAGPPLPLDDDSIGFIYAYSVFSHFSEEIHRLWLEEFKRVLRPGGALAVTVRPRSFLEHCVRIQAGETKGASPGVRQVVPDAEAALIRYDEGEFCFSPYFASGKRTWWGEASIPRAYIDAHWTELFQVLDFRPADDLKQHIVMLRA